MIKAIIGEIAGLTSKDFVFASLLPTLIFVLAVCFSIADIIGFGLLADYFYALPEATKIGIGSLGTLGVIGLAYLVNGMRSWFLLLWSGQLGWWVQWYFLPGQWLFESRYRKLKERLGSQLQTYEKSEAHQGQFRAISTSSGGDNVAAPNEVAELRAKVIALNESSSEQVVAEIVEAYKTLHANSTDRSIEPATKALGIYLGSRVEQERSQYAKLLLEIDRSYGDEWSIKPTVLGNAVESFNAYPFKRYGIEGEVFWPHLQEVLPQPFRERIAEARLQLDFFLSMATLAMAYFVFALIVGPWLKYAYGFWVPLAGVALLIGYVVYYRMAFFMALGYGDLIRSAFDLYRLDLLAKFSAVPPATRKDELARWKELSKLVVYGQLDDFSFGPKPQPPAAIAHGDSAGRKGGG